MGHYRAFVEIRDFVEIKGQSCDLEYSGLVKEIKGLDCPFIDTIIRTGKDLPKRADFNIGNLHVKKLSLEERAIMPPKRFTNSILMTSYPHIHPSPSPWGLIYAGSIGEIIKGQGEAYFLTNHLNGSNLLSQIEKMSSDDRRRVIASLGMTLKSFAQQGIYPLDFAPRDIMIGEPYWISLVDTEHLIVASDDRSAEVARKKQKKEFKLEYSHLLTPKQLELGLKLIR
ncbi:MAG: hypothetical protein Q7R87_03930 [Nanoarchaeota archaeon]|nr:hypothetical protein [Nanoarchaeota archaeon]